GGGSNGVRTRLWKVALQGLADEMGVGVSGCHFPPGARKGNKIEHRRFCPINQKWRGPPPGGGEKRGQAGAEERTGRGGGGGGGVACGGGVGHQRLPDGDQGDGRTAGGPESEAGGVPRGVELHDLAK